MRARHGLAYLGLGAVLVGASWLLMTSAYQRRADRGFVLCAAADLRPLAEAVQASQPEGIALHVVGGPANRLDGVRSGACDAALIGYEPYGGELDGLRERTIAYDAVVILVDENTFVGGEIVQGHPVARGEPLPELPLGAVKGILGNSAGKAGDRWQWTRSYARWETCTTPYQGSLVARGRLMKCWVKQQPVIRFAQRLEPGKFDTQTYLFRRLQLDELAMSQAWPEITHGDCSREEQVLAREYRDPSLFAAGSGDFQFRLTFASQRVARLAVQHAPVRVVSVNGVDPIAEPAAILDGRYPLTRSVHLVVRAEAGAALQRLTDWLVSPSGQGVVAEAGVIPAHQRALSYGSAR